MTPLAHWSAELYWFTNVALALFALFSLRGYWLALTAWSQIRTAQTALSTTASQGYAELKGTAQLMSGDPIIAPLTRKDVAWYQYRVRGFPKDAYSWFGLERGTSDAIFWIEDEAGSTIVDPDGATVLAARQHTWYGDTMRPELTAFGAGYDWLGWLHRRVQYQERNIQPGDRLYVLGEFQTVGEVTDRTDQQEIADLMRSWKTNPEKMQSFDLDHDQHIDSKEWQLARQEAERVIQAQKLEYGSAREEHIIRKPRNPKQPFIIASGSEDAVRARFFWRILVYAGVFAASLLGLYGLWVQ
ncbi:MAG: GIDE domain-containing protein [Thiotrichales bacterium]